MVRRAKRHRRPVSAATRAKESAAHKGKRHPHRGVRPTAAARARESAAHKGKHHHHRGHRLSAATRAKISRALKGRHHKTRCHCGSSSKNSLKHRRAAHFQKTSAGLLLTGSDSLGQKVKTTHGVKIHAVKARTKKRGKARGKRHVTKTRPSGLLSGKDSLGTKSGGKVRAKSKKGRKGACHCPKRGKKKHARLHKHLARHVAHGRHHAAQHHLKKQRRQKRGKGKTSIIYPGPGML